MIQNIYFDLKRVGYGSKDTPINKREYKASALLYSPVGTIEEWNEVAKQMNFKYLRIEEIDGKVRKVMVK